MGRSLTQRTIKIAYTAHGFHFHLGGGRLSNALFRGAEQFAARYTDALLTINREDFDAAKGFRLAPRGIIEFVPGIGLDLQLFNPQRFEQGAIRALLRERIGVPKSSPLVLMVAEFIPRKRHRDLIAAVARCSNRKFHVLLAGEGREEVAIRRLTSQLGLENRVHFLGFRRDIPELLAGADLLVLPCEREGLPACVMEGLAMSKPVVGADARGTRDLLAPDCGWLHKVGDVAALANLIDFVLEHPSEALCRAVRGRERVSALYGWSAVRTKLISVYRQLGVHLPDPSL